MGITCFEHNLHLFFAAVCDLSKVIKFPLSSFCSQHGTGDDRCLDNFNPVSYLHSFLMSFMILN